MDLELTLIVLVALAVPGAGIAGFVMALNLRQRIKALEIEVERLGASLAAPRAGEAPEAAPPPAEPEPERAVAPAAEPGPPEPEEEKPEPPPAQPIPQPPRAAPGLEERLGSRWAVWIGGLALTLGGVLLVRYSIEQGLLGPAARVVAGAGLALGLIGAGEWFRRRETPALPGIASAHVPGVLTAAGTATAFATAYAAYALYGFMGPNAAFLSLGFVSLGTLMAAALHGPGLAALGLVAALASPLLVSSQQPQPWTLVLYVAFVVAATYGLARLRRWKWLAISAAVGAGLWGIALIAAVSWAVHAAMTHVLVQTGLAALFLVADANRGTPDEAAEPDWFALSVMAGFAILAVLAGDLAGDGQTRAAFAALVMAVHLGAAVLFAPAAGASVLAAAVVGATLALWPVAQLAAGEPQTVVPGGPGGAPMPEALTLYLSFAGLAGLTIAVITIERLRRGRALPLATAALYAGAGTVGPLGILVVTYWRVTAFDRSVPFALVAGALALLAIAALRRVGHDDGSPASRLTIGALASAAVAAVALGLSFALDKGMLTVAFALAGLGTAWVAQRAAIPVLRYAVAAIGVLVLGRIAWDPAIAGGDLGREPILNWLLWGYGVPAVSFALAARLLESATAVARFCRSLAILFAALLVFFEIRHAIHGGDPFAVATGHLEMGLIATEGLLFSLVLVRLDAAFPDVVYRTASLAFGAVTLVVVGAGLALIENPLLTGQRIEGGSVLNSLLLAYLLPATAAGLLAWAARGVRPRRYVETAAVLALVLQLLYTVNEIRRLFQGPDIGWWRETSQAELWTYSAALVVIGVVLLAYGLVRGVRLARLLSAPYIVIAVLKVFVVDLSNLEGALRALSFIGLGLVLVGIGLAYQRLLASHRLRPERSG